MSNWGLSQSLRLERVGAVSASTDLTVTTTSATANTKGSYTQLIASTAFNYQGLWVQGWVSDAKSCVIDFAVGAAASETIIIPNYFAGQGTINNVNVGGGFFPLAIPAGTRISARSAVSVTGTSFPYCALYGMHGGWLFPEMGRCEMFGNAAASRGVVVDPGGTANTKGAWTQIAAATSFNWKAMIVRPGFNATLGASHPRYQFDIGVGAGGSEVVLIPDLWWSSDRFGSISSDATWGPFLVDIPAGTRISCRVQSNLATVGERELDMAVYGIG
jgi:hypothetical protein